MRRVGDDGDSQHLGGPQLEGGVQVVEVEVGEVKIEVVWGGVKVEEATCLPCLSLTRVRSWVSWVRNSSSHMAATTRAGGAWGTS